jgi:CHASE2 domain-containing sensor protein
MELKNMSLPRLGHWAFLGGIVLAILAGFIAVPNLAVFLFVLGLIVGFLNINKKESTTFLVAVITLLLAGAASLEFGKLMPVITPVLNSFIAFVSAAGLIVALKQVWASGQPNG